MAFAPVVIPAITSTLAANASMIAAGSALIGGGVSAYAANEQGKAAQDQARYQAGVTRSNAMQAQFDARTATQTREVEAESARLEGAETRRRLQVKSRRAAASLKANLARRGIELGSISLEDSLRSFNQINSNQLLASDYDTALKTRSLRHSIRGIGHSADRALTFGRNQSQMLLASGSNQRRSAGISAIGQGLSGATRAIGYFG